MEHKNALEFEEHQEDGIAEGWRKQDRHVEEADNDEAADALLQRGVSKDKMLEAHYGTSAPSASASSSDPSSLPLSPAGRELRLVLLGQTGAGKSTAGNCILGSRAFNVSVEAAGTRDCESRVATVAGRQLTVVDTPDWFCSEHSPEEVQRQIRSCLSLVAPGPHAFLLCIPVDRPASLELLGLDALEMVFGPGAVGRHTLVLFTHMDQLPEGLSLEEYVTKRERQDLLRLVERCGDHYHALQRGRGGGGGGGGGEEEGEQEVMEKRSVEELLEKVEQVVRESGADFHASTAPQEPENRGRLRRDREEGPETDREPLSTSPSAPLMPEPEQEAVAEAEGESGPVQAKETTEENDDDLTGGDDSSLSPAVPPPSFLRGLWDTLAGWVRSVPGLVRGSALLGALVGFFVGGPVGSMLGVTVGSVATEVGRRKRQKKTQ